MGLTRSEGFELGQRLEVLLHTESSNLLSSSRIATSSGDLDHPLNTSRVSVRESVRGRALGGGRSIDAALALRRVEPVEVRNTGSSSVPALGAGAEDGECEVGATASGVSLTLGTGGETIELSGETEAGRERAADCTTVVAEEEITTAGDGVGVSLILETRDGGGCDCEEASDGGDLGEGGDHCDNVVSERVSGRTST